MREMSVTEQRYKAVLAAIGDGRAVSEVATDWGVFRRTMHQWLARYEGDGLEGSRTCLRVGARESDRTSALAPGALLQIVAELLRARGVAELAQSLGLDLADALPGHPESFPHFFQRALVPVTEPEAELEHTPLARGQRVEKILDIQVQHRHRGSVRWRDRLSVLDKIAEMGVLLLTDRGL